MRKTITHLLHALPIILCLLTVSAFAQVKLEGKVTDSNSKEPLAGVSIAVKGKVSGTITDTKGNFSLNTNTPPPFQIVVSSVGFETQEITVDGRSGNLNIVMAEQVTVGQEVVVSASRVEESVLKSPVSVEKLDIRAIQQTPSSDFYGSLSNIKGIDIATQGLLFKSVNMRGFGATGNPRTVQMIDGMDNSAPGLNFPVDNIAGIPELDVESVEILPGAASALYGPNAIQGLILMTSKSPFLYQGLSANVKTGIMSASNRNVVNTPFYDATIRYAKAFNNKVAFKLNASYLQAKDWQATDYTNLNAAGSNGGALNPDRGAGTLPNYDGMNVYGDENLQNIQSIGRTLVGAGLITNAQLALIPNVSVSRTGWREQDLVDYNTKSLKLNAALHYRLTEKIEAIGQINYGYGTTVYTAQGRYSLRNFGLAQAKLELRGDNFTLRAYTTQENSGQSYASSLAAVYMNESWKASTSWFPQYVGAFVAARAAGQTEDAAHLAARGAADTGRPVPGTAAFTTLLNKVRDTPIAKDGVAQGGGGFSDNTALYHLEGVYNLKNQIKFADVIVGANYRSYQLKSDGTLFADRAEGRDGVIPITEYGGFLQVKKSLFNDHLTLTGSTRYDKNQNFKGQFTPRLSAVATFGDQNIRLSYQTGFRIPTTQNQYIDLQTPVARLIGGLPEFYNRYNLANSYSRTNVTEVGAAITSLARDPAFQQTQITTLTAAITPQVVSAVRAQITPLVTQQVNALVAAGQLPAAAAPSAITAGVAAQLALPSTQSAIAQNVTAQVQANAFNFIQAQAVGANVDKLQLYKRREFKPERVANYEIGYRGVINKRLFIDAYYYYSVYKDFLTSVVLIQPTASISPNPPVVLPATSGVFGGTNTRNVFSMPVNSTERITASGWAIGLNYSLPKGYGLSANLANNTLNNFTQTVEQQTSGFNTPKYRWNLGFNKRPVGGSPIGFAVQFKAQDAFVWEGFGQPSELGVPLYANTIVPAIKNIDVQVNYKVSSIKSIVKVGATNLFGKPYIQAFGSPAIGSMYYVSLSFDELLN